MKYVVVLADGMADEKIRELGEKTPLEYAYTPHMAKLAPYSIIGDVKTIPEGCPKGSDTANLAVLGYNPKKYYCGRSPLEALSIGVELQKTDVTFRVNLVTLSEEKEYQDKRILDYGSDEITTEEAGVLIGAIAEQLGNEQHRFYTGAGYRHLLVWDKGSTAVKLMPPHDIVGVPINDYKPQGENAEGIWKLMQRSYQILDKHPLNELRRKRGLKPANSIWIWGEGTKPQLPLFKDKHEVEGAVISAMDLIKGIGIGAGMTSIDVPGATGNMHTNYEGKVSAATDWLINQDKDFVYIHLEGPDECGHRGELDNKIKAIEEIDARIIGPVTKALQQAGLDYRLMVLPDHPTPIRLRTHTGDSVPFMIYDSRQSELINIANTYTEEYAKFAKSHIEEGHFLIKKFLSSDYIQI